MKLTCLEMRIGVMFSIITVFEKKFNVYQHDLNNYTFEELHSTE